MRAAALAAAWLAAALPVSLSAAQKPRYSAIQVFENLLTALDEQASLECVVLREERGQEGGARKVSGTLKVRRGGMGRLEVLDPSPQLAVSDGKFLWVELPDVKQVMKYDARQLRASGNFFLDLASSVKHYARESVKRLIPAGEGFDPGRTSALELMPLSPGEAGFERMRVWVDDRDWLVRQVGLGLAGVDTVVRFEGIRRVTRREAASGKKSPVPASQFRYRPPRDYQVFDLTVMP